MKAEIYLFNITIMSATRTHLRPLSSCAALSPSPSPPFQPELPSPPKPHLAPLAQHVRLARQLHRTECVLPLDCSATDLCKERLLRSDADPLLSLYLPLPPRRPGLALLVQVGLKSRVLRDMKTRQIFQRTEALRRAYLFVARNVTLPDQVRMRAQHRLAQLPRRSTPNLIKNTCIKTGKQRGASLAMARGASVLPQGAKAGSLIDLSSPLCFLSAGSVAPLSLFSCPPRLQDVKSTSLRLRSVSADDPAIASFVGW